MNELITKEIVQEYSFKKVDVKSKDCIDVYSRDKVEIVISDSGEIYYSNMGFDYPLANLATLKKLFKELRDVELR